MQMMCKLVDMLLDAVTLYEATQSSLTEASLPQGENGIQGTVGELGSCILDSCESYASRELLFEPQSMCRSSYYLPHIC